MIVEMPIILMPGDFVFTHTDTCTRLLYVLKGASSCLEHTRHALTAS
jgi:hypothetical protein